LFLVRIVTGFAPLKNCIIDKRNVILQVITLNIQEIPW
jgi:hypothetical protein